MSTYVVEKLPSGRKLYQGHEVFTDKGGFSATGLIIAAKHYMNKGKNDPIIFERVYAKKNGKRIVILPQKNCKTGEIKIYWHEISDNELKGFIQNDINFYARLDGQNVNTCGNKAFDMKKQKNKLTRPQREQLYNKFWGKNKL